MAGALITTLPHLAAIALGLVVCATCGSSANDLDRLCHDDRQQGALGRRALRDVFYVGGSAGAFFPSLAWSKAGWPATVRCSSSCRR